MEPHNNNQNEQTSNAQDVQLPDSASGQTSVYHTISGGPETLEEVRAHEEADKSNTTLPNNAVVSDVTQSTTIPAIPPVETGQENIFIRFFDRHTTLATFIFLIIGTIILSLLGLYLSRFHSIILFLFAQFSGVVPFIAAVFLGAINFRGRRKEIFLGVTLFVITALVVGFGLCLYVVSHI